MIKKTGLFVLLLTILLISPLFSQTDESVITEEEQLTPDNIEDIISPSEDDSELTDAEVAAELLAKERKDAQNIIYKGEHHLYIGVGMMVPIFMHFYNNENLGNNGFMLSSEHYDPPVGLSGFFDYKFFLNDGWALGAELGGAYIRTTQNAQTLIHLGAEVTYMIRRWPVDIPISFEIGGYFNTLRQEYPAENLQSGGIFFKPEIGFSYNINENWGVGGSMAWWVTPEIYLDEERVDQSVFAHAWALTVNVRYRFK